MASFGSGVNLLAVLVAGVSYFILGGLWYSPLLFGRLWLRVIDKSEAEIKEQGGAGPAFAVSFASCLLASFTLASILTFTETLASGLATSLMLWLGFVAASNAAPYFYEDRPKALYLIYVSYSLTGFLLMTLILTLWS